MPNLSDYNPAVKYGANLDVNVDLADIRDHNNNEVLEFDGVASAVNYIQIANAATGNNPVLSATGEADLGFTFQNDQAEEILVLDANATAVNHIEIDNAATSANPSVAAVGDDTNIGLQLTSKGTGLVIIGNSSTGTEAGGSVTINAQRGVITTSALTTGTAGTYTFDFVNNKIGASSQVLVTLSNGTNTAGLPVAGIVTVGAAGSANITLVNADSRPAGTALNGTLKVNYIVLS